MKLAQLLSALLLLCVCTISNAATAIVPPAQNTSTQLKTDNAVPISAAHESLVKDLSRKEKRQLKRKLRKQLKSALKDARKGKKESASSDNLVLAIIFAILIPPLGMYIWENAITNRFWISLLLTILFWLPGVIYTLVVILGES